MTTKREGQLVHPKMFPLRSAYDITITSGSKTGAILDYLIFREPLKIAKIDPKVNRNQ